MCSFVSFKKTAAAAAVAALILPFTHAASDDQRRLAEQHQILQREEQHQILHSQARAEFQRRLAEYPLQVAAGVLQRRLAEYPLQVAAGVRSVAVGDGATATGASAVALGAGTAADRDGTVSVGGRQIVGVADGTQPGDVVTVRQLESALAGSQVSEKIDGLRGDLQSTERRVSAGVAMALAMSQPVSIAPGDTSAFTAAAGNFNGQSALAIGVHHTPIPGLLYSAGLGVTTGSSSPAIRVGLSLSF